MKFSVRRYEARPLKWWYSQRDRIEFSPSYQRSGSRWNMNAKAFLVDSVLNGFDIPKFYLADFSLAQTNLNTSNKLFAIIDGKQRLEAFFDFFSNSVALARTFEYLDRPSLRLAGMYYSDLQLRHPDIAARFDDYIIDVVSVVTDDPALINQMFLRLNRSMPLSGSEIRNAMEGLVPRLTSDISRHEFFLTRTGTRARSPQNRLNNAGKLLMTEFRADIYSTTRTDLDRFVETGLEAESSDLVSAAGRVVYNLERMCNIFEEHDYALRSLGNLVVYYWLVRNYWSEYGLALRDIVGLFAQDRLKPSTFERDAQHHFGDALMHDRNQFNMQMRSVNAAGSLIARYTILETWLIRMKGLYV